MKTKWKKILNTQNAKHFKWPEGWDTAEEVASQLECSPERVREHLAPSIRSGEVEVKVHTIWCSLSGRKISKTGYRMAGAVEASKQIPVIKKTAHKGDRVVRARSANKEVGIVVKSDTKGILVLWPNGEKIHSALSLRKGDLKIIP